ncbi:MAG: tRNA (adenosine(37)-N6)-threonylcarbamoyltransferase complex dimerization subunit type 1 TsaB [Pseudomonadota bacterium]|nr:tRNA (adenosine(37)-N6)-threonylcarbamoyltransferase complex dimerization subunit type 1 TsaB [Pseudomonadota bacterium]
MKILALETATEACSVALWIDGDVRERFAIAPRQHAELALPWADALLAEAGIVRAQLDAIAVGRGPGAFTGVRLAIALAQGIALALDKPVVPVSTLAVLAASLPQDKEHILAAIDARMGEIYFGAFARKGDDMIALSHEAVIRPELAAVPDNAGAWFGAGTGFAAADGALQHHLQAHLAFVDATALPHAANLARLAAHAFARGEVVPAERAEPAYLRDNVALTLEQQQALRASR